MSIKSDLHETMKQMMLAYDIDPFEVVAAEIGESGYMTRRRDSFGKSMISSDGQGILLDVHEWPKGFPSKDFLALYDEWRAL